MTKGKWIAAVALPAAFVAPGLKACLFCDIGAKDAGIFVLAFFGLFVLGMACIALAYLKRGAFRTGSGVELRVLEAEGIVWTGKEADRD